jgi:Zn-dependent protease
MACAAAQVGYVSWMPTRQGSIHLFRLAGVDLYLHWSWFLIAIYLISQRGGSTSLAISMLVYLTLFVIVFMHEMGHALACRSVGGKADEIVLWPLGGVAYIAPPQRPGATLWSIVAGPLVNVVLFFVLGGFLAVNGALTLDMPESVPLRFAYYVFWMNGGLLAFNLLPIYPLDGGQIVRSLLWFVIGRAHSLMVTVIIGFVGLPLWFLYAWWRGSFWLGIMGLFILANCWRGLQQARVLARAARLPRRDGFQCPSCHAPPPIGGWWRCSRCGTSFDTFETLAVCPHCGTRFESTRCLDCGEPHPMNEWLVPPPPLG